MEATRFNVFENGFRYSRFFIPLITYSKKVDWDLEFNNK